MKEILVAGILLLFGLSCVQAQEQKKPPKASTNTSIDGRIEAPSAGRSSKNYKVIYKWNMKGLMSGNRCVEETTRKMGFIYEVVPKEGPGSKTQEGVFFHNLGVKTLLFFRNGPFWTTRLKKRIKECRKRTGDYMG